MRTTPDPEALTFTIVAEFAAPPAAVWELWADPRKLERWWGPPTWPARFAEHDLVVGGRSHYVMTGPDGGQAHGWWLVTAVDAPRSLEFEDGFAREDGSPDDSLPTTTARVVVEDTGGSSRMTVVSRFASAEQMQQLAGMGMEEGMRLAMGQMDDLLVAA
nr:SRPBCC domain-containing protein [Kineococcus siccus]